jgi:hypothetical protein
VLAVLWVAPASCDGASPCPQAALRLKEAYGSCGIWVPFCGHGQGSSRAVELRGSLEAWICLGSLSTESPAGAWFMVSVSMFWMLCEEVHCLCTSQLLVAVCLREKYMGDSGARVT